MTRSRVKLALISDHSSRKKTFRKRNKSLVKKVKELSTLCGISACAVIYSPNDPNPEVWPSKAGVESVVSEFRALPVMEQQKRALDQETFLRKRIDKTSQQFKKERKESREREMTEVMFQCLQGNMHMFNLNLMDLNDLGYVIDQKLEDLHRRFEVSGNSGMEIGESSNAAAAPSECSSSSSAAATAL